VCHLHFVSYIQCDVLALLYHLDFGQDFRRLPPPTSEPLLTPTL